MNIISFNIWHGARQQPLREYIQSRMADTDMFCFQETLGEAADEVMADLFSDDSFQGIVHHKRTKDGVDYALRTYVRKGITVQGHHSILEDFDGTGIAARFDLLVEGQELSVVSIHGIPRPGHKLDSEERLQQSQKIIQSLDEVRGLKVICGDFNLMPHTESIKVFEKQGYRNLIQDFAIETTRNRLAWERYPESKQLYADYVFVSPEVEVVDFVVPYSEASDHLPLELMLKVT